MREEKEREKPVKKTVTNSQKLEQLNESGEGSEEDSDSYTEDSFDENDHTEEEEEQNQILENSGKQKFINEKKIKSLDWGGECNWRVHHNIVSG